MTPLHTAAQIALDALEAICDAAPIDQTRYDICNALRKALAQPAPVPDGMVMVPRKLSDDDILRIATSLGLPFGMLDTDYCKAMEIEPGTRSYGEVTCEGMVRFARAMIAASPAAHVVRERESTPRTAGCLMCGHCAATGERVVSPAVPLTAEQLAKIAVEDEFLLYCDQDSFNEIARAIEAAHGITGDSK